MDYKSVLKEKNKQIGEVRTLIETNRIIIRDTAASLAGLKGAIRQANRDGKGATVSKLSRERNVRQILVRTLADDQVFNRQTLREMYILRRGLIADWVAAETE